ncbi:MFS transporter [Jatrophihabitans endophyticus]|uniref:MFS transporter n=1 Tax=Jatrophihabitans endophyticus TaxID=1206085 RepID=UPI0019E3B605|nr:MFS transporter [Jatrophihabitans endophyticus]MBE7188874.1 MFS transporter [Jatrophihabitans endophyticus]
MFDAYRAVFRTPGTAAFCAAGFVMRLPIAMYPIGLVLIVSSRSGHYGFAGVLSAVYVIANGIGNPALARASDRFGQTRLLVLATLVHVAGAVVLAVCFVQRWADWTLVAPTVVTGFAFLSVGSMLRARWSYVLAGRPELSTAYSLESALDEVIFVVGPLVATVLATQLDPVVVLYVAAALVLAGAIWLSSQHGSAPPPRPHDHGGRSALVERGIPLLVLFAAAMGMIFASAEVTFVAFAGQHGHRALSGVVLACFAGGSAVAGFVYGSRTWRPDLLDRFRLQAVVFALLPLLFLAAVDVGVLAVLAFVVGAGISPTLITSFGLVERLVPGTSLTEGLAWVITGLSVGYGAGAALVGGIADAHGARTAFLVTIAAGLLMGGLGLVEHARLRTRVPVAA